MSITEALTRLHVGVLQTGMEEFIPKAAAATPGVNRALALVLLRPAGRWRRRALAPRPRPRRACGHVLFPAVQVGPHPLRFLEPVAEPRRGNTRVVVQRPAQQVQAVLLAVVVTERQSVQHRMHPD
jgi:hypothetical protein